MDPSLTILLAGCGRWGRNILRDLVGLGTRVAVADPDPAARELATAGGAWRTAADAADLPDADGAVVAVPTVLHAVVAGPLLARGMRVFVEKPLTPDPDTARELVRAYSDRLFVMDKWRHHPGVEELARIARTGELGPVLSLTTVRIDWGCPQADVDPIWILAPHDLSIGREVLGHIPEPRAARAEVIDGTAVGLTALLGDSPWQSIEVSARSPVRRREVRLACRDGVAVLGDAYAEAIEVVRADGTRERRRVSDDLPLRRELAAFVGHLRGGPPPKSSAADGLATVEALARLRAMAGLPAGRSD
jgi:predicted dehydrogenase